MKTYEQLDQYNAIWLHIPAYHDLTPNNKSHEEVSQWNGKEMEEMSQYLLGVVAQSQQCRSSAQYPIFNHAIGCTQALLEFNMYARYRAHNEAAFSYIEHALHRLTPTKMFSFLGEPLER